MLEQFFVVFPTDIKKKRDYLELRKWMIVTIFLHIVSFVLVSFMFVNFYYQHYALVLIDLIAAGISLFALNKLKYTQHSQKAITISTINLFVFFLIFMILNKNNDNGLLWLVFFPLVIIPMNGYKKGLKISILFYFFAFILAFLGIDSWQDGAWNFHSYIRFVVISVILVYITYVTELTLTKSFEALEEKDRLEAKYLEKLQELSTKDALTGLYNRREITKCLQKYIQDTTLLSVAIVDIDFFKHVNDTYGHNVGDEVLVDFAHRLLMSVSEDSVVGRWGGEEFVILFLDNEEQAYKKALKILDTVGATPFNKVGMITCSIGVSSYNKQESLQQLIDHADKALYMAKTTGRNKVCRYTQER